MKTKEFFLLDKLVEVTVKIGHNKEEATEVISKNYDYIKRVHPGVSTKKAVHIAYTIY